MHINLEEEIGHIATPAEAVEEWRFNVGPDNQDRAWLLHDRDVWVRNPYYVGPPVPHPEDDGAYADWMADQAAAGDAEATFEDADDLDGVQGAYEAQAAYEDSHWQDESAAEAADHAEDDRYAGGFYS